MPNVQKTSNEIAIREAAIERVTLRLATASDEEISELVRERRAMRDELGALRRVASGNVVSLDTKRPLR